MIMNKKTAPALTEAVTHTGNTDTLSAKVLYHSPGNNTILSGIFMPKI